MAEWTVTIWTAKKPETVLATYPVTANSPGDARRAAVALFKTDNPQPVSDFWAKAEKTR